MSTHLDGAPPSDGGSGRRGPGRRGPSAHPGFDDGSHWVRAEIARRMAANRSTRRPHAAPWRRGRRLGRAACPRCRRARHPARAGTAAPAASGRPAPTPGLHRRGRPARELRPAALRADPGARGGARRTGQQADPDRPPGNRRRHVRHTAGRPVAPAHGHTVAGPPRSAVVRVLRCRSTAPRRGRGHGRPPPSSRTSPCSDSARRPAGSVPTNRCPTGGCRPPHRGVSRPRATRMRTPVARRP